MGICLGTPASTLLSPTGARLRRLHHPLRFHPSAMSLVGFRFVSRGSITITVTTPTFHSPIPHRTPHLPVLTRCRLCDLNSTASASASASSPKPHASVLSQTLTSPDNDGAAEPDLHPPQDDHRNIHQHAEGIPSEPMWRKISSNKLGITHSMITRPTRIVLNSLKKKGYQVYLVGGCVRDLVLKRTPKDFDVITSADLKQVMKTFSRCQIVGRRFPICHVYIDNFLVEVSSFTTSARNSSQDWTYLFHRPCNCDDDDFMRWSNCLKRDFTINGLMFDPYRNLIYDYTGGFEDIKKEKVRTVIPPHTSFQEDCARILRAIRIAARLNFHFERETALSIKNFSHLILRLDKGRLLMETNYMLAYGSAEASLRTLWKLGLLEILLPIQAAYFVSQGFRRRGKGSNMLLSLFSNLDRLLAPDKPCNSCLWAALLVFHKALVDKPRDPLVIATFILAVRNGGNISEVVSVARKISYQHDSSFSELKPTEFKKDRQLLADVLDLASSVNIALNMMTDETHISRAMSQYTQAPRSNLVIISFIVYQMVYELFECFKRKRKGNFVPKRESGIDYKNLLGGDLAELRHVFARVVFDTVYPPDLGGSSDKEAP